MVAIGVLAVGALFAARIEEIDLTWRINPVEQHGSRSDGPPSNNSPDGDPFDGPADLAAERADRLPVVRVQARQPIDPFVDERRFRHDPAVPFVRQLEGAGEGLAGSQGVFGSPIIGPWLSQRCCQAFHDGLVMPLAHDPAPVVLGLIDDAEPSPGVQGPIQ